MNKELPDVGRPLNAQERYLYAMTVRLDALCEMVASLVEEKAKSTNGTVENQTYEEVKVEEEKPKPRRKRAPRKKEGE